MGEKFRRGRNSERREGESKERSPTTAGRPSERGQAQVLGFVLIIGLVTVASVGILVFGTAGLDAQRAAVETEYAQQSMIEFAHGTKTVVATDSDRSDVSLGPFDRGHVALRDDAGRVTIAHVNESGATVLYDEPLGALTYANGDTEIAYQGGGVWRTDGTGTTTLSSPAIEYHEQTVSFSLYHLNGDRVRGSAIDGTVRRSASPSIVELGGRSIRELEGGTIRIAVESEYCGGWERQFETTIEGSVTERCSEGQAQRVRAELPVPISVDEVDSAVIAETIDDDFNASTTVIDGDVRTDSVDEELVNGTVFDEGYTYPSVDDRIAAGVERCEGKFKSLSEHDAGSDLYCVDEINESYEFDTTARDVDVVVRDSIGAPQYQGELTVTGDNALTIYVNGSVSVRGGTQIGNESDPSQTRLVVSSHGDVSTAKGSSELDALIYAPDSNVSFQGNPTLEGSVVGERVDIESNIQPGEIRYDSSIETVDVVPTVGPGIRYAAITGYEIELDD